MRVIVGPVSLLVGFKARRRLRNGLAFFERWRGYQEVCPLTSPELLVLHGTLAAIQLLFMAFSLETHAEEAARRNASVLNWLSTNKELVLVH